MFISLTLVSQVTFWWLGWFCDRENDDLNLTVNIKTNNKRCRALCSCGLMRHVLDREVGGSNPGESVSFSPGCRLDLTCLFFWTRRITIIMSYEMNSDLK